MEAVLQEALRFAEGALPWWQYLALVLALGILLALGRRLKWNPPPVAPPTEEANRSPPIPMGSQMGPDGYEITAPIELKQKPPKDWL